MIVKDMRKELRVVKVSLNSILFEDFEVSVLEIIRLQRLVASVMDVSHLKKQAWLVLLYRLENC